MRTIREYDFNIWCPEDDVITLSAYKLTYLGAGVYNTDTTDWEIIRFNRNHPSHRQCVKFLLDFMNEVDFHEDMDWWGGTVEQFEKLAPEPIAKFARGLKAYEVEDDNDVVQQAKEVGKPYGEM